MVECVVLCGMLFVFVCLYNVSLPEWSKGLRSGRNVFERVGSNPTADMTFSVPRPWRSHWRPAVPFMRRAGVRLFFFSHCARFALGLSSV